MVGLPGIAGGQSAPAPAVPPAGGTMEWAISIGGARAGGRSLSGAVRMQVRDSVLRHEVRMEGAEAQVISLMDLRRGEGTVLLPAMRTFMRLPRPLLDSLQRQQRVDAAQVETTLVRVPGSDTVAGVPCERWRLRDVHLGETEACVAAAGVPTLPGAWGTMPGQPAGGALAGAARRGVTLRLRSGDGGFALELRRFDPAPLPETLFRVPDGYREQPFPTLPPTGGALAPQPPAAVP